MQSPPLFCCFGLVVVFLAAFRYRSGKIFSSQAFSAAWTLGAVVQERVTALLGVPTMFNAEFRILEAKRHCITTLRTGLAAGSPVPPSLFRSMKRERGFMGMLISCGMTENSPVTFIMSLDDSEETMSTTIGRVLPHTRTKVVDPEGNTALVGQKETLDLQSSTGGSSLKKGWCADG
ncbi:acyl-CoA synthetases /AMP-acid ligases II [Verticillium alfalfae VaMs.102]|uniref:Acyl-CoA synthetases /AMP-acid ligases II n=1 Tax=Verticillium alfalfae (strain VaMs.102 / ATCC MYA-4576 / FGSC 10136) TaxID=526221 RepID=C9SEJ5_VERA1|nr:acyl-CoA synthetases /AMP-acid ligases II [Verticillium alfalfae VaMs.102]EEY16588.1 acyl-CoA synthetases /AMP-acid ligases II [Verticillium alfalfae VaMs.102]